MENQSLVEVLVEGHDVADHLAITYRPTGSDLPQISFVGSGWWELQLPVPLGQIGAVADFVREGGATGLIGLAGGADLLGLILVDSRQVLGPLWLGDSAIRPPGADVDVAATLATWSIRSPKPLSTVSARRLLRKLHGSSGDEAFDAIRRALGIGSKREWWHLLEGCIGPFRGREDSSIVGLENVDWTSLRCAFGRGEDFHGLWDRDRPGGAVERWPLSRDGLAAAEARRNELIIDPILEASNLEGERWFAQLRPSKGTTWRRALLLHRSPKAVTAVLWLSEQDARHPSTWPLLGPGEPYLVSRSQAAMNGFTDGPLDPAFPGRFVFPLSTIDDAKAAIRMDGAGLQMTSTWQPVPSDVPGDLLATSEWVINALPPHESGKMGG